MFAKKKSAPELLVEIVELISEHESPDQQLAELDDILLNRPSVEESGVLVEYFLNENVFLLLIKNLKNLSFEARKNACLLISFVSKRSITGEIIEDNEKSPLASYILAHVDLVDILLSGLDEEISVNYSSIIKDLIKKREIVELILNTLKSDKFEHLFNIMNSNEFEGSSEASVLFKELILKHKETSLSFLEENPEFFEWYAQLLKSSNFATKSFTLHLLGDVLLDPEFEPVMLKFVDGDENLKLVMELLTDVSSKVKLESFNIFKIFVINPDKTPQIRKILFKNKDKLIEYLQNFTLGDVEIEEDKQMVISVLEDLKEETANPEHVEEEKK